MEALGKASPEEPGLVLGAAPSEPPRQHPKRRVTQGSNNAKINPRSQYATEEPDFAALAEQYPALQPFVLQVAERGGGGSVMGSYIVYNISLVHFMLLSQLWTALVTMCSTLAARPSLGAAAPARSPPDHRL